MCFLSPADKADFSNLFIVLSALVSCRSLDKFVLLS